MYYLNPRLLHRLKNALISIGSGNDFPVIAVVVQVVAAGFQHDVHQVVFFGGRLGHHDLTFLVKHPGNRAGFTQVPAALGEGVADLADGAVAIVRGHLHQQRHAARAVTFKSDFFVVDALKFASTALDGALDVVGRHVLRLGSSDSPAQSRITFNVASATLGGHGNFFNQTGEYLAALGVQRA